MNARRSDDIVVDFTDVTNLPFPSLKSLDVRLGSKVLGSVHDCDDVTVVEKLSAYGIEVVDVVFVAENDGLSSSPLFTARE